MFSEMLVKVIGNGRMLNWKLPSLNFLNRLSCENLNLGTGLLEHPTDKLGAGVFENQ